MPHGHWLLASESDAQQMAWHGVIGALTFDANLRELIVSSSVPGKGETLMNISTLESAVPRGLCSRWVSLELRYGT